MRALALQFAVSLCAFAQSGPVNLDFKSGDPGQLPSGWTVTGTARQNGELSELRRSGCFRESSCVLVRHNLQQKFDAETWRGRVVVLRGWLRVQAASENDHAAMRIVLECLDGRKKVAAGLRDEAVYSANWQRNDAITYVDQDIRSITIAVVFAGKGESWVEGVSFEPMPRSAERPEQQIPPDIRAQYARIDRDVTSRSRDDLDNVLDRPLRTGAESNLPFDSRISGFKPLLTGGAALALSTGTIGAEGALDDHIAVRARAQLTRSFQSRRYVYELEYLDVWTQTAQGWRAADTLPVSLRDVTPGEAGTPADQETSDGTVPCGLKSFGRYTLGGTDYNDRVRPRGSLSAVMIFVDFPDGDHDETPQDLYEQLAPFAVDWIRRESGGKAVLNIQPVRKWFRLPRASREYQLPEANAVKHRMFILDAVNATAPEKIDFLKYDIVYIVAARAPGALGTGTLNAPPGYGVKLRDGELRQVITFGNDIRGPQRHVAAWTLAHETEHLFGLPDLYEYGIADLERSAGEWSIMSGRFHASHLTAWEMAKLGWFESDQNVCVGNETRTATLTPVEIPGGLKSITVPVSDSRAYVAEVRELIGDDVGLCSEGVLIYAVDTSVENGRGPLQVIGGDRNSADARRKCGPAWDAPMRLDGQASFHDATSGVTIELIRSELGAYTVRASRTMLPQGHP
jgi:M6 family metalloprotease-like protein